MLNRFKNVLYGTSDLVDDTILDQNSAKRNIRRDIVSNKLRNRLTRSSSFRDDLIRDIGGQNNDSSHHDRLPKSSLFSSVLGNSSSNSQCSPYPGRNGLQSSDSNANKSYKEPKFHYTRPEFLQLRSEDEILVSADHEIRPIILPRDVMKLPWKSGYAECINSGKSIRNEDQAAVYQDILIKKSSLLDTSESVSVESQLPWFYFGLFDGHAGDAVAVAAANQLHKIIALKLQQIADLLIALEFEIKENDLSENSGGEETPAKSDVQTNMEVEEIKPMDEDSDSTDMKHSKVNSLGLDSMSTNSEQLDSHNIQDRNAPTEKDDDESVKNHDQPKKDEGKFQVEKRPPMRSNKCLVGQDYRVNYSLDLHNLSTDSLIRGALESAFWEMDQLIERDKADYIMPGGCTALVAIFILGKLYVTNAGDSRAIVCKDKKVIPMSFDFTPTSEKKRVLRLGQQRPDLMGNDFTHLEYLQRPTRADIGKMMLYRDAYMTGWAVKQITPYDLKFPLVWGEGKRSRVLATIGVTRGFGDHELKAQNGPLYIKPFLTAEPEVRVLNLEEDDKLTCDDVLIMGTDGLWDVTSNEEAAEIVASSFILSPDDGSRSKYRYISAAQDLIIHSRGLTTNRRRIWKLDDEKLASMDDIAVFVIPIKQFRDDYVNWKKLRNLTKQNKQAERPAG